MEILAIHELAKRNIIEPQLWPAQRGTIGATCDILLRGSAIVCRDKRAKKSSYASVFVRYPIDYVCKSADEFFSGANTETMLSGDA